VGGRVRKAVQQFIDVAAAFTRPVDLECQLRHGAQVQVFD
jgi:hypothetical protein